MPARPRYGTIVRTHDGEGDGLQSSDSFSYTVQARCRRADAVALLGDLSRQGELHPLIVRVRQLPPRPGALASYAITDRLELGPLHFPVTYQADVLIANEDEVVTVARQQPATTVRNHTRMRDEPDGVVRIDVEITLTAPAPLFGYAFRQARAAHLGLAARLGATLEGRPA
ncbi:SRPBCC family protein [Micromonospora sp. WMMD998]|uniref:SRPBCC family protein n=1 Tax=Micromonospora sp. WMMD998 TaxID=3016092 RepID=UPI00249AE832|nr:SRPBCC family protein [Micromonospora sp. WMMD998]WFE41678.1 SRPBCC family protein [Micromonospora sp. WMMD998]